MSAPMTFALDFDGTFAADPALFREIVAAMRARGHVPVLVTQRCEKFDSDVRGVIGMDDLPIVYASGRTKEDAAREAGYAVNVWIDDAPYSVFTALVYRGCE